MDRGHKMRPKQDRTEWLGYHDRRSEISIEFELRWKKR